MYFSSCTGSNCDVFHFPTALQLHVFLMGILSRTSWSTEASWYIHLCDSCWLPHTKVKGHSMAYLWRHRGGVGIAPTHLQLIMQKAEALSKVWNDRYKLSFLYCTVCVLYLLIAFRQIYTGWYNRWMSNTSNKAEKTRGDLHYCIILSKF